MSTTLPRPAGSEMEEAILRHVDEHLTMERQVMADYAVVAETSPDAYVRYLSAMILDDERRHTGCCSSCATASSPTSRGGRRAPPCPGSPSRPIAIS